MYIRSFTVDRIIDQNVPSRSDSKLASSVFKVVREHRIVALTFKRKTLKVKLILHIIN